MDKYKNCALRIDERLYRRITQHIQLLKRLNIAINQQKWMEDAILKKLDKQEKQNFAQSIHSEKNLGFKINIELDAKIEKMVEIIKKFSSSYSKKKWILESIYEKLELEEKETEITANELLKSLLKESVKSSGSIQK